MNKVFVYGSLLSGMGNHGLLANSRCLGETKSPARFSMLDLGYFPGVIKNEQGESIIGEVYEIDDNTLRHLDQLEGYRIMNPEGGLYNREEIETEFGVAYIYTYNNNYGRKLDSFVFGGDWRTYYNKKIKR